MSTQHRRSTKGVLLGFEGIDASGKNTQSKMLFDYLSQTHVPCELISFPDYTTPVGREIRNYLEGSRDYPAEARHMLYAANRYELKGKIQAWVSLGKVVVINRYSESNLAYGVASGLPLKWLGELETLMPRADYVFYLKIAPRVSMDRKQHRDRYETDLDFLTRVSQVYDALAEPGRWITIDASQRRDLVHYEIVKFTSALLPQLRLSNGEDAVSIGKVEEGLASSG